MGTFFGIDAAGYSTRRTAIAKIERNGERLRATVYRGHAFAKGRSGWSELSDAQRPERELLAWMQSEGTVYVDVPIDLQELPDPKSPRWIWQLQKRPVDEAFSGLAPLADRLGAPVSRFRALGVQAELGKRVFETYPKLSLHHMLDLKALDNYKGWAGCVRGKWDNSALGDIAGRLRLEPDQSIEWLTDHELDAVVCALAGVHRMDDAHLHEQMHQKLGGSYELPKGFKVAGRGIPWESITVTLGELRAAIAPT